MPSEKTPASPLVLGWAVDQELHPKYWLTAEPKFGQHTVHDLVTVAPSSIAYHTAVIAQSGSGKSFFLGRLIEEILLRTKARCLVFDPNADYRKITEVNHGENTWEHSSYNYRKHLGKLTHERASEEFSKPWGSISKRILTLREPYEGAYTKLELPLFTLSAEVLIPEEMDPILQSEVEHCHTFTQTLFNLITLSKKLKTITELLNTSEELLRIQRAISDHDFRSMIEERYPIRSSKALENLLPIIAQLTPAILGFLLSTPISPLPITFDGNQKPKSEKSTEAASALSDKLLRSGRYTSDRAARLYFATVHGLVSGGLVSDADTGKESVPARLTIVDLPSIQEIGGSRRIAINALLQKLWVEARNEWSLALNNADKNKKRVPTFIIIDEAHHLVPAQVRNNADRAVRDGILAIAAEGRKYGLFLILVSQRPDKLDPLVLSECQNQAVMKLGSKAAVDKTVEVLGLHEFENSVTESVRFRTGRALLLGQWVDNNPIKMYVAWQRTIAGGAGLEDEYWAVASESKTADETKAAVVEGSEAKTGSPAAAVETAG